MTPTLAISLLFAAFPIAIVAALVAGRWKRRHGGPWALIMIVLAVVIYALLPISPGELSTDPRVQGAGLGGSIAVAGIVSAGIVGLILAFLPKGAHRYAGELKTCPKCAEEVKTKAMICRFCGHEFGPAADNNAAS